jgi:hypothetical protein
MKPSLYIDPSGTIRYMENCPEQPERDYSDQQSTEFLFKIAWREYEQALQAAKDSAVPLDSNYLNAKELFDSMSKYTPAVNLHHWLSEHKGEIIPLPDNYSVEVKIHCDEYHQHTKSSCKVAILTPYIPESQQESQELIWVDALYLYNISATNKEAMIRLTSAFTITRKR